MSDQPHVEVYVKEWCPYCDMATDLLDEKGVEYETYAVNEDADLFEEMVERADGRTTAPEVFVDDELIGGWDETSALDATGELDEILGLTDDAPEARRDGGEVADADTGGSESAAGDADGNDATADGGASGDVAADGGDPDVVEHRPLIVAGTGIAGLTAAIYAARSNHDPLVIEGDEPGGQLTLTTDVANYPGFPEGIGGPELVQNMKEQARRFGAELQNGIVESVDAVDVEGSSFRVRLTNGDAYAADAVIAASGASARTLGIPGEDELMGYGLSTCATCDGAFFRGEDMLVVGGGDAAMEEASFLTRFADTVYVVHRREEFRAEDYWIDRVMEHVEDGEIEIMKNTELLEVHGSQEGGVDHVTLVRNEAGHPKDRLDDPETEEFDFDVGAVFLAIGHTPNTEFLEGTGVETDADGYLRVRGGDGGGQTETDVPGIFGAGDVVDYHYQQAVTAAGMGCQAAIDADSYLEDLERAASEAGETAAADD